MPKFVEGFADRLKVPTGARDVQVFDDELPGFGIRKFAATEKHPKGLASYFVKYNIGRQQRKNGAFTKAMIEGLSGAADVYKRGYVDTEALSLYVRHRVVEMTKQRQEPVRIKPDAAPEMKIVLLK